MYTQRHNSCMFKICTYIRGRRQLKKSTFSKCGPLGPDRARGPHFENVDFQKKGLGGRGPLSWSNWCKPDRAYTSWEILREFPNWCCLGARFSFVCPSTMAESGQEVTPDGEFPRNFPSGDTQPHPTPDGQFPRSFPFE